MGSVWHNRRLGLPLRTLLSLTLVLFISPVFASECKIFDDSTNHLSFGAALLGDKRNLVPRASTKSKECLENFQRNYFDCEYTDESGVSYLVEGDEVIRKEIRNTSLYRKPLIASVTTTDSLLEVVRKLATLPRNFPEWSIHSMESGDIVLTTGFCLKSSNDFVWAYYFSFTETGHIKTIGARVNW